MFDHFCVKYFQFLWTQKEKLHVALQRSLFWGKRKYMAFHLFDWFHFVYFISFIHFVHFITLISCCHISKGRHIQALKKGVAGGRVQTRRARCCSLQTNLQRQAWWHRGSLLMSYRRFYYQDIYISGWWFQIFFIFIPTWGRFPFWLIFFKGVETTN